MMLRNWKAGPPIEYIFEAGKLRSSLSIVEIVNGVSKNIPVSAEEYVRHQFLQMYKNNAEYFLNNSTLTFWRSALGNPNFSLTDLSLLNNFLSGASYKSSFLQFIKVK